MVRRVPGRPCAVRSGTGLIRFTTRAITGSSSPTELYAERVEGKLTLILCCATSEHVLLASDRRLTFPDGRVADDVRNKAAFFAGRWIWGYTGVARISHPLQPSDEWLVDVLAGITKVDEMPSIVATKAAKAVRHVHARKDIRQQVRRLAFISIFFGDQARQPDGTFEAIPPTPVVELVSNFSAQDHLGNHVWLPEAAPEFGVWTIGPMGRSGVPRLLEFGQRLSPRARMETHRDLQRCDKHGVGVQAYARVLARAIQRCHDEGNAAVGRNVTVTWAHASSSHLLGEHGYLYDSPLVPLLEDPSEREFFMMPRDRTSTGRGYFYLPGDRNSRDHYAPSWVGAGLSIKGSHAHYDPQTRQMGFTMTARTG